MSPPAPITGSSSASRRALLRALAVCTVGAGLGVPLAACAPARKAPDDLSPYTLRPGDRIAVHVHGHPDLSGELTLDAAGLVRLPLAGTTALAGLTVRTAERRVAAALEGSWVRGASVAVDLVGHVPVFVLGEVQRAGRFPYRPGMTVLEAVALAGGYTYRARTSWVTILRPDRTGQPVELSGTPATRLLPGDGVHVPERIF